MPQKWLQIKDDLSVRDCFFQQTRVESLFDGDIERNHQIVQSLLISKGAFHVK